MVTESSALTKQEADTNVRGLDYSQPLVVFGDDHFDAKPVRHCVHTCCKFIFVHWLDDFTIVTIAHFFNCDVCVTTCPVFC